MKGSRGVPMSSVYKRKKKPKPPKPEQRAYKYRCLYGHIRIEKEALGRPLPHCPACSQAGRTSPFKYVGKYTIPKDQLKKSKFN
ncbi:hypothetical protein ACE41H_24565 [Paenibacillus enshidis]|uniref:Uncharacterized protein n=1 Tax=Paenibacillus enshidis TaxID=1458439 RepID=A0ABV5B2N6_9BACL